MQRRRLTALTIMYIAGITAGYFMLERSKVLEAAGFMAALAVSVCMAGKEFTGAGGRCVLIIMMAAGFTMFFIRYTAYEAYENKLLPLSDDESYATLTGTVRNATMKDEALRLTIRPEHAAVFGANVYVTVRGSDLEPSDLTGCSVSVFGRYKELTGADDPGCFDNRIYRRGKGTGIAFTGTGIEINNRGEGILLRDMRRRLFEQRERFLVGFSEDVRGFLRGVIFGDKSEIDEELRDEFNINQTGHILAVSGLHIGFLYSILRALSGRRRTIFASSMIMAVLLIYGEMTMWSPATLRACIVTIISLLSVHLRRDSDLLTSVSLAALLILIAQPYQLFDTGFQMSFLALGGIAFFTKPLSAKLGSILGTAASVQLGVAPIAAFAYSRANILSIFINIPIILLSSLLVPVCILLLFFQIALGAAPVIGIEITELLARALIEINHILSFEGVYSRLISGLGAFTVITFYVLAFVVASEWMRIRLIRREYRDITRAFLLTLLPLMMLSACCFDRLSDDEIVFVSVGQGDCVHIKAGSHDFLIDGGGNEEYNIGKNLLMPYLLRSGAGSLDIALATHLHMDHFKGIEELAEEYPVAAIGVPKEYKRYAEEELKTDSKLMYVGPETEIRCSDGKDEVSIETIWPVKATAIDARPDDANEHNTVYMINYGNTKVMVTGDLLEEDELEMVEYYKKHDPETLKCDVLKVAHHGSKSSSCGAFLDAADPAIAVIQVGRNNLYGHPHEETIRKLEERGIKVLRTDISGAVGIDIKNKHFAVDTYKKVVE